VRTVYLGTSAFAAAVLDRLAGSPHRPALVVTRPARPKGRGRRTQPTPVAQRAAALGLESIAPEKLHEPDVLAAIDAAAPAALVVCAFGVLIREPLLSAHPILNVHPSLLPRWRGAAPVERAIMAGDTATGVSIMRLTAGLDSGPVALQGAEPIHPDDDYGSLAERLQVLGGDLLVRALDESPPFEEQPEDGVTYAGKIEAGDRALDPALAPEAAERTVRALRPHIGARIPLPGDGGHLGVVAARVAGDAPGRAPAGGRLRRDGDRLLLDCRGGSLELLEVQPPGGRAMRAADWLRGRPVVGFRLDPTRPGVTVQALVEEAVAEWDPDAEWQPALEALARRGDADVLDALELVSRDPRRTARALAATGLGQLGAGAPVLAAERAAVLEAMAEEEPDHAVLSAVACALGHLGEPYGEEALLALHRHPDAEVRDAVAFALLGRSGEAVAEARRTLAMEDRDPRIRMWAALGAGPGRGRG
jgi:methionyl-tRNA formyltransferase